MIVVTYFAGLALMSVDRFASVRNATGPTSTEQRGFTLNTTGFLIALSWAFSLGLSLRNPQKIQPNTTS